MKTLDELQKEIERLRYELDALKTMLPKTADGVPVVPGMTVWLHNDFVDYLTKTTVLDSIYSDATASAPFWFSTKEAAETALNTD